MECQTISVSDSLTRIRREHCTRKRGVYIMTDKYKEYIVISQKLAHLSSFLTSIAKDESSTVSVTALHECLGQKGGRTGGYAKYRWKLIFVNLDRAAETVQRKRGEFETLVVAGNPQFYELKSA